MEVLQRLVFKNFTQKALALAFAIVLVAMKRENKITVVTASVRVRVTFPDQRVLTSPLVDKVRITVEGEYSAIRNFEAERVPPVDINLSGLEGDQVSFEPGMFKVPPGLRVRSVRPAAMIVRFEERKKKVVQVVPLLDGEPQTGFRLIEATVQPPSVVVVGAASAVERLTSVNTERVSLVGRSADATLDDIRLGSAPAHVSFLDGGRSYTVKLEIDERKGTRVLTGLPIMVRGLPEGALGYELSPARVDLSLHGPVRLLQAVDTDKIAPFVDVSGRDLSLKVLKSVPVSFTPPKGLRGADVTPRLVTLLRHDPPPEVDAAPPEETDDAGASDAGLDAGLDAGP